MFEVLAVVGVVIALTTVVLAALILWRLSRLGITEPLTKSVLLQLLREETDTIRKHGEEQARGVRQDLAGGLDRSQATTVNSFGALSEGVNAQLRDFGERLDRSMQTVEKRIAAIGEKLDQDIARLGTSAEQNRENLRALVEGKLDAAVSKQGDEAGRLREELNQSFERLGTNVATAMTEMGERQKERLDTAKAAIDGMSAKLDTNIAEMGGAAERNREALRKEIEGKLGAASDKQAEAAKALREELGQNFHRLGGNITSTLADMSKQQQERLEHTTAALAGLGEKHEKSSEALKAAVEGRLDYLRQENTAKLDEMRQTVDEKLQSTLETRLGESFNRVVEQLNRVHEGLGEMKSLASNVGDLKNVLTNVKVRGTYGEVQLEMLMEQFLTRDQYVKDAQVKEHSSERVEFAVKMPGGGAGEEVLIPIDAKFPRETYDRLIDASQAGDEEAVKLHRKRLEAEVRGFAKTICEKYINPPVTTNFAILFLPTEGLYAEVLRQVGVIECMQREHRVTIAGPTTLAALLNALQMGFRSLAIEKRSGEVWKVLGAVKTEFGKYNTVVEKLGNQLAIASKSVDSIRVRTRAMDRKLRGVEESPDSAATAGLLGFDGEDLGMLGVEPVIASTGEMVDPIKVSDAVAGSA